MAGASGGTAPGLLRLVACITAGRFYRAGHFSWALFWPFTVASVPCAFLGGALVLPGTFYQGIGGGIFLGPLLLGMGWAEPRQSASVSAAFILVNSVAGLVGETLSVHALPSAAPLWAGAVVLGGIVGSELGARQLAEVTLRRLLAVVLALAGLKLIFMRR